MPKPWCRRLTTIAFAVVVVGLAMAGFGPAGGLIAGFIIITPLELIFRRHDQRVRRPGLRTDMVHLLVTPLLSTAGTIVAIVAWAIVLLPITGTNRVTPFSQLPTLAQGVVAFVTFELMGYLAHRLMHEVPLFWRFHSVHHSSRTLDWISGARAHPVEGLIAGAIVAPPLLVFGVRASAISALSVFIGLWGALLHANVRWRLRFLDGWWGTPEYHHWHHSNHPEARNKNYAAILPVFDRLFGSYYQPKDRRPTVYGLDDELPGSWWAQLRHPFRGLNIKGRMRHPFRGGIRPRWETAPAVHGASRPTLPDVRFVT